MFGLMRKSTAADIIAGCLIEQIELQDAINQLEAGRAKRDCQIRDLTLKHNNLVRDLLVVRANSQTKDRLLQDGVALINESQANFKSEERLRLEIQDSNKALTSELQDALEELTAQDGTIDIQAARIVSLMAEVDLLKAEKPEAGR